jgi:glycosyltransferase involved in cell wall biosynthesis
MKQHMPLVTIGIPTYNRAAMLRRSIESALCQDYAMLEVIISNNASTDNTHDICQEFSKKDDRVKYVAQSSNRGASANFAEVLKRASGEYFMWLGDDDWIDALYVSHCVSLLEADSTIALVSGAPIYYQDGTIAYAGKLFDLLEKPWAFRVARYYAKVADNGMFYGIMRTAQLQKIAISNTMGGDWHLIANIVCAGKTRMSPTVFVHRELGGATASYRQIAKSLGLPKIQAVFPMTTVACGAWESITSTGAAYEKKGRLIRICLAGIVFLLVIAKPVIGYAGRTKQFLKRNILFIANGANSK